jgi:hypothetical protein
MNDDEAYSVKEQLDMAVLNLVAAHRDAMTFAARVVELEREKRELSCDLLTAHRETIEHAGRIIELERELKALRDDAERWQYARRIASKNQAHDIYGGGAHWSIGLHSKDCRETIDAAIDAARGVKS